MLKLFFAKRWYKNEQRNNMYSVCTAFLSIVLCIACLAGTTCAWFTSTQEVAVGSIASAQWKLHSLAVYEGIPVNAAVIQSENESGAAMNVVPVTGDEGGMKFYALANTRYTVTVTIGGNATRGFLLVKTCDGDFYTEASGSTFQLLLSQDCEVSIGASWGVVPDSARGFSDGETLGMGSAPTGKEDDAKPEVSGGDAAVGPEVSGGDAAVGPEVSGGDVSP